MSRAMADPNYTVKRRFSEQPLFAKKQPLLRHLDIELTERCNNACIHCYINLPVRDFRAAKRELTTAQWLDILRQAADLGALSVRFTGGEPLLRADFAEIYLHTRRLGMQVMLFTNARLITAGLADLWARVPPLKKIEISVYGMRPESYDAVACAPGAFAEFRHGVELLLDRQIPFVVKPVLLPPYIAELSEFEDWAESIPWMDKRPTGPLFLDLRTRRDSPARNRLIASLRLSPQEATMLLSRHAAAYRKDMAHYCAGFVGPQGDRLFTCPAGESGCVDAYGVYQMCMQLRHPQMTYDLKQGTLREALTTVFPRLRKTRAADPEYLKRCVHCFLKGMCEQCPAKAWQEYGTLDTPVEYLCEVAHAQARYLDLLDEHEHAWEIEPAVARERLNRFISADS
jgi:radical SAM protein with 4Fe4S-binding SPASM domain